MPAALSSCTPSRGQLGHARELYVADVFEIADVPAREDALFAQAASLGVTRLTLYGHRVLLLDTPDGEGRLRRFVGRARGRGITSIAATIGWDGELDSLADYVRHNPDASPDEIVTEIEYWNACDTPPDGAVRACFAPMQAMLDRLAALRGELVQAGRARIGIAAYLGWPSRAEAQAVASRVDRVLIHCEQPLPELAYDHPGTAPGASSRARLRDLAGLTEIWPIFYARGESHMGAWITLHGLDAAEQAWTAGLLGEREPWACDVRVGGFTYFDHRGLGETLGDSVDTH